MRFADGVRGWLRRRQALTAALIHAALALALVAPALVPGRTLSASDFLWSAAPWSASRPEGVRPLGANVERADAATAFEPFLEYSRATLPDLPLWNPHVMAGRPFLANAQSAVFSPFSLPAHLLGLDPGLALIAALKLFAAAFGTYLLGRALGMRFPGAILAGVVYGFSLWMVTWLAFPHSSVWALLPWLLLAVEQVVRRPDPLTAAGLAAATGLVLVAGHPESSFHAVVAATCFLGLRLGQRASRRTGRGRALRAPIAAFVLGLAGGAALAAVALLPFAELLLRSADLEHRAGAGDELYLPRRFLLGALLPEYWGRPTQTPLEFFLIARALYVGALPLMLAGVALIVRPARERIALAVFGAVALAVVAGLPPVFQVVTTLPVFSSGHNTRLVVLYVICLALLAGFGLDELSRRMGRGRRRLAIGALAAALVAGPLLFVIAGARTSASAIGEALELAWGFADAPPKGAPSTGDVIRLEALVLWLSFAGVGALLLVLRMRGRLGATAFAALAVALVAVDLFRAGMGYNPAIREGAAAQPLTGSLRYLQSRRSTRFAGITTGTERPPVAANTAMRYGLYDARGYDYPVDRRYDRLWRRHVAPNTGFVPPTTVARATERSLRALSLLGVADVIQAPFGPRPPVGGLRLAYRGSDARVYANARALPRAFVVHSQRVVGGEAAALEAVVDPGFDPRQAVVAESPIPGLRPVRDAGGAPGPAAAVEAYERERVVVRASTSAAGLLVLSDLHYPGWKATVDGRQAEIERVDYLLRGVPLPAGEHRVEFRYEPLSWRLGSVVSVLALVGLALAMVLGLLRRRRARSERAAAPGSPAGPVVAASSPAGESSRRS